MSQIVYQVHDKFKVFVGPIGEDHSLGPIAEQIARFVNEEKVAAKSIGAEYLETSRQLVLTLGYRSDEATYPIAVQSVSVGKVDAWQSGDITRLEKAIEVASDKLDKIICHSPYITEENEFVMVFLLHQA